MRFGPSTVGAGGQNTSRIQKREVYATLYLPSQAKKNAQPDSGVMQLTNTPTSNLEKLHFIIGQYPSTLT